LHDVLSKESKGLPTDRLSELKPLIGEDAIRGNENKKTLDEAHWYVGEALINKQWIAAEQISDESLSPATREYLRRRGDNLLDASNHVALARWAQSKGLSAQSKAHWFGALDIDPSNVEAQRQLGFERIGDRWFSREEITKAYETEIAIARNTEVWLPKIRQIAIHICNNNTSLKSEALAELRNITAAEAIPSLLLAANQLQGDYARPFVAAIRRNPSKEACLALVKFAVSNPSSPVVNDAIAGIKEYRQEFYVPDLLSLIEDDTELRQNFVYRSNGDLVLEQAFYRETMNSKSVQVINRVITMDRSGFPQGALSNTNALWPSQSSSSRPTGTFDPRDNPLAASIANKGAETTAVRTAEKQNAENLNKKMFRDRAIYVLKQTTGIDAGDQAKEWWQWFDVENDTNRYETKTYSLDVRNSYDSVAYTRRSSAPIETLGDESRESPRPQRRKECLVKDTLIQTNKGLVPIQSIRVGDLVLACNVETGELAMKPVLRTMLRPPTPTMKIITETETIQATPAHYWWISGRGWLRTKELDNGMPLHTATGTSVVQQVNEVAGLTEAYNLVVDEHHTYFVGRDRVLSYDGTELQPTLLKVPGFQATRVITKQ
jgi:hypothetical protein